MRWVAVWSPDNDISEEEFEEYARPLIARAAAEGLSKVELEFPDGRVVNIFRISLRLPVMVEAPEEFAAFAFRDLLIDRAFDDESGTIDADPEEVRRYWHMHTPSGVITLEVEEGAPHPLSEGKGLVN